MFEIYCIIDVFVREFSGLHQLEIINSVFVCGVEVNEVDAASWRTNLRRC